MVEQVSRANQSKNQLYAIYPEELRLTNRSVAFFSLGDREVQERWSLENRFKILDELKLYLKVKTILYDVLLHSPSFVKESDLSYKLYTDPDISPLFIDVNPRISANLFVLSENLNSFAEHVEKKRLLTPESFSAYHSDETEDRLLKMRYIKSVYKKEREIGSIIADLWMEDLIGGHGSLANMIKDMHDPDREAKLFTVLSSVVKERGEMQLSPAYVSERLERESFPSELVTNIQGRLLDFYVAANASALAAQPLTAEELVTENMLRPSLNPYSVSLFLRFADILGIRDKLCEISGEGIIMLRTQPEFRTFLNNYLDIVKGAESIQDDIVRLRQQVSGERRSKLYTQYNSAIQAVSVACLTAAFQYYLGQLGTFIALSMAPSIVGLVDGILRGLAPLERTPFLNFKRHVLEEYKLSLGEKVSST
jgi:hypothetical protein